MGNTQTRERVIAYFDEEIVASTQKSAMLLAEHRADEANFEKIRGNVFGIFKTVFCVAVKTFGDDDARVQQFFKSKVDQIPENWKTSYRKAKEHNDVETMQLEKIKLGTLDEIKTAFRELWGKIE